MAADGAETPEQPSGTGRGRRNGALALVIVASLLAFPAILAIWVNRQLLNTDNWTETSTQLLENRLIRDQVATFLVNELYTRVDVQGELQQALPPRLQPLAGPAAGALRDLAERSTRKALARPRAQERWAQANRQAHIALLQLLEGGGSVVSTQGGKVVLDLRSLLGETATRFGVGGRIQGRLPASAAQITILESDQLDTRPEGAEAAQGPAVGAAGPLARLLRRRARARAPLAAQGAARLRRRVHRRRPRGAGHALGGGGPARRRARDHGRGAARDRRRLADRDAAARAGRDRGDRLRRRHGAGGVAGRTLAAGGRDPAFPRPRRAQPRRRATACWRSSWR